MNTKNTSCRNRLSISKAITLFTIGTLLFTNSISDAQAPPASTRRMGYAMINDALYIEGGFDTDYSSQFTSLDLSTSWPTSSPAWHDLSNGQPTAHLALAPVSAASNGGIKGSVLAIGGMGTPQFYSSFDINSGTWTNVTSAKAPYFNLEGQSAVSDPNTGLVYIIGGVGSNNTVFNQLTVYDPKSKTTVSQQAATAASSLIDMGAVWLTSSNTILTFGGTKAPPAGTQGVANINSYNPTTKTWTPVSTSGDVPPARLDHCMAASSDGSKVVVFGGTADGNSYFNTIYILDVKSGKWKQGQTSTTSRTRMSCAFHSYQLIVWGGSSGASRTTMLNNLPIVYNLNQDKWTDNYNSAEVERKSNVAGIAGGIFAAVIIIGGGVGFYLWKRKQKREQDAYHKDAVAAAAISSEDRDANIKVLAEDNSYEHIPYGDYLNYGGYGNNYPLNNVGAVEGYHGASDGSDQYYHAGSPLSGGSEKYPSAYSPSVSTNYYGGMAGTPYIQSPPAALIHHQSEQNPFVSPEDYHHPPGSGITSAAVSNGQHPSPTWVSRSPMPGARSPQAIPDSSVITSSSASTTTNSNGYIPPPPM